MAVLNNGDVVGELKPLVPHILTDIMSLESLLCDDDIPQEIGGDRLDMSDPSVFLTFLQLAELKLYKIVRWARNLPYFANISVRIYEGLPRLRICCGQHFSQILKVGAN